MRLPDKSAKCYAMATGFGISFQNSVLGGGNHTCSVSLYCSTVHFFAADAFAENATKVRVRSKLLQSVLSIV